VIDYNSGKGRTARKRLSVGKIITITIELPEEVAQAVEEECQARGESRDTFFRHALDAILPAKREAVERYIRGYREHPETAEDIAAVHQSSVAILAQQPWD